MRKLIGVLLVLSLMGQGLPDSDVLEETVRQTEAYQVAAGLSEEELEIGGELRLDGSYDLRASLHRLWQRFLRLAREKLLGELGFAGKLVLIAMGCSLGSALYPGGKAPPWIELACCASSVLLLGGSTISVLRQGEESLAHLQDYARAAFPAFFTTVAACGAPGSAAVHCAAVQVASDLFMSLANGLLLPLIEGYLSVSVCLAMFDNALLRAASKLLKWAAVAGMSLFCTGYCVYIGLTGTISGSADAAAVKGVKTVIAATLPVVGGILSDSAGSLLAAAEIIKNSAGAFCLISVCAICAGPAAVLGVKLLALKAASVLASLGGSERYCAVLDCFSTVLAMLLGLVGAFGMMLFFSILSGIRMTAL